MIGHVFTSSGAVTVAVAPSAERPDEYIVLARTETGYAVANVLTDVMSRDGGPAYWLSGRYFDTRDNDVDLRNAAVAFTDATLGDLAKGLHADALAERLDLIVGGVRHVEQVLDHRAHLTRA